MFANLRHVIIVTGIAEEERQTERMMKMKITTQIPNIKIIIITALLNEALMPRRGDRRLSSNKERQLLAGQGKGSPLQLERSYS